MPTTGKKTAAVIWDPEKTDVPELEIQRALSDAMYRVGTDFRITPPTMAARRKRPRQLTFLVRYVSGPDDVAADARVQDALADAMRAVDVPFTVVPPDLVSKARSESALGDRFDPLALAVPDGKITSFRDIPKFMGRGNYAVDYTMKDLVKWLEREIRDEGLELEPDFQRGHVWTEHQQVEYIEFLLRGGRTGRDLYFNNPGWTDPVPEDGYRDYVCVDGLQRITAIRRFVADKLEVFGSVYSEFTDRPSMNQDFLRVHVNDLKSRREVLTWYLEMNAGGTPHSRDELSRVAALLENT